MLWESLGVDQCIAGPAGGSDWADGINCSSHLPQARGIIPACGWRLGIGHWLSENDARKDLETNLPNRLSIDFLDCVNIPTSDCCIESMRIRHTWNKFKCNGHHLPFYKIYAWPENNAAKGYPCPVALMQIHVHTNVWISTHLTPMIIRVCSQNLQYFYRLMDMSNTKLRLKIVFKQNWGWFPKLVIHWWMINKL